MNRLSFSSQGLPIWVYPMPSFLIDGVDLVKLIDVTHLAGNDIYGVGVDVTDPFVYPEPHIGQSVRVGCSLRQLVLNIHLGDTIVGFVTVNSNRGQGDNPLVRLSEHARRDHAA